MAYCSKVGCNDLDKSILRCGTAYLISRADSVAYRLPGLGTSAWPRAHWAIDSSPIIGYHLAPLNCNYFTSFEFRQTVK